MNINKNNTKQIKTDLINAINQTDNPVLLIEISRLIDFDLETEKAIKLSKEQVSELEDTIMQIENGNFLTLEESKKQADDLL